ncbi:MAG: hypothetical protein ACLR3J_06840 [Sutterella wadsworthensis]
MFLDEIFRPKTGDEVLMSAEDMRQARINRYGTDDITPVTAQDYSDKFNTELTPEEEAEFQSWAKENNRERDSYDYDIRGAWKELKSGSMSEDERGHLGDKYKKPNHPTFSDQSVYNGKDGVAGGTWSEVDGKTVFTPGRMLSKREAEYLSDYFRRVEPDVKLNLDGKIIKPKPLPGTGYEPGWFEGLGDTWLGMNAALAETKSAALTALSELPIGTEQEREGWLRAAEATRAYSKTHYEADPELMGAASQIIHGLFKTIPKAGGYMAALGPGAGAVAFGADMGISESQRLKDEGVDQKTRTSAGVMSFAANAIGLRLPGAFGSTRLMSTLYGAGANIGTDVAERKGIQLILENQNYGELAKQYEVSGADLAVSGIFGGAFGALGYRSPQAKFESEVAERRESLKKELMKAGRSEEQADVEAGMTAPGEVLFAKQAGVDWKDVDYTIEKTDSTQATDGFHMPVTQGIEWHMGPRGLSPDEKMRVVSVTPTVIDKGEAINIVTSAFKDGIHNEDTGFTLRMSKSDAKKSAGKDGGSKRKAFMAVAENIREIAESAKLVESHVDIVHKNPKVRGIHVFLAPISWNGELWRVQLLVKDTVEEGPARAVTHSIDGVYVEKMETPPGGSFQSEGGVSYVEGSPAVINRRDVRTGQVAQDRTVSVSQLMGGSQPFVRKDGRAFFDPVDESARQIDGAYYENAIEKAKADGTGVVKLPDGRFEVKGSYDPKKRKITLTPKADISTFAHEHSHWYLDMLMKVLGKEDIDPDLREGGEALLRSWGIKSVEDWDALGVEGQRKYQEWFAAWTEIYLSKGKSPVKGLEGLFERFGQWIVDLYKKALGLDPESAVKDRYKSETGEDLPPLSKEMEAVIRRMYGEQQKAKSVKPTPSQVVAARMVQAQRVNEQKLTAPMANPNDPEAMDVAIKAQRQAAEQLNNGQAVDVGATLQGVQMNDVALTNSQKHFARAVQMGGDNSSLVVLQNRDRSKLAPVAQMNAIAANPQYGRVSFSRTTDTGAPIVSFGSMPDERYQGITDWVMDGGEKIPVTYAVVEADSVLTSNDWSGRAVDGYGDDPTRVHAVAGNGRLAGLNEAFERGTATQYVADMMADRQQTGINPEAVGDLKRPVLVRFMPSEKVTTGFIDRSNQSAVLELSGSERAVQDASKLTSDKLKAYQFDENGEPTRATLDRFVNDIGEPSAIGGLIDGDGKPTEAAKARVMAAVFYKAYRDPELTSLMSVETDKQGMKRVLNAMAAFAPHVIRIREMSGGAIDLGPAIVDAAHMLKSGEVPMDGTLIDDVSPVARQMFELLYNNRKSAAAIGRVFNGFTDSIVPSLGEGTGMLLGNPLDLADAMSYMRRAQNAEIQRQMDEGKTGLALMPDVDVATVREALKAAEEAKRSAENLVSAMGEKVIQDAESKQNGGADDAQAKAEQEEAARIEEARARSLEVVGKSADMVRLENLAAEKPNQTYVLDDSGVPMTMEDVVKEMQRIEQEADIEAAGIGKAAECILRNGGIQQ